MGQPAVNEANVIDETFVGLATPSEVHSMGRPDILSGRPGEMLVEEVQRFEAEGGFKEIARIRNEERLRGEASDTSPAARRDLPDFGIRLPAGDARDLDVSKDPAGEK